MELDEYLKGNLPFYYFLIVFLVGILYFLNLPKPKRHYQIRIAKYFLIASGVLSICLICGYALKDVTFFDSSELVSLIKLLADPKTEAYESMIFLLGSIGVFRKLTTRIKYKDRKKYNSATFSYSSIEQAEAVSKPPSKMEVFFYEEKKGTERRELARRIVQVVAFSLIVFYLVVPIFDLFDIDIIISRLGLLLFILTFLEFYYSLCGEIVKPAAKKPATNKKDNVLQVLLNNVLKLRVVESLVLNQKMIGKNEVVLNGSSALVCEVTNANEIRDINLKIMNTAFFEKKRVLVISLNGVKASNYHARLSEYNKEYDGKLIIKLLTENDKLFDSSAEMYVTAIENCFGNIKLLSEIDTIIFEDYEELLMNKLELMRALGGILKMGNDKMNFVVLSYNFQGIEATIKSLLHVNTVNYYCTENKQQPSEIEINVWEGNPSLISTKVFGNPMNNIGSLIPLALLGSKWEADRILFVSNSEPVKFELNELNSIRNLYERNIDNDDLKTLSDKIDVNTNEKYFEYRKNNWIIADDKYNLYEKIYKLTLISGVLNKLNIASEKYLLRDYMISTYRENKPRLKEFLPYVPYEVNSGRVVLYNLLLQLTNYGVKESIIYHILNENNVKVEIGEGNNTKYLADSLNAFILREFDLDIDVFSYLTTRDEEGEFFFDASYRKYRKVESIYVLDAEVLRLFPNEIFERVSFIKDGFAINIEKEYAYNIYQKYLPGQKHFIDGYVYEIRNIVESDLGMSAILETSTTYDNNTYRQDRVVSLTSDFVSEESKTNRYSNIVCKYYMGKVSYDVTTNGYFEFIGGISRTPGDYRYVELDPANVEKIKRKHKNADAIKIEINRIKSVKVRDGDATLENQELGQKLAFLISEVLYTMLGENFNYIQVKSVNDGSLLDSLEKDSWTKSIKVDKVSNDCIEVYILEDTKIERGLIDMIYKNLDNIFRIIKTYLKWVFDEESVSSNEGDRTKFLVDVEQSPNALMMYRKLGKIIGDSVIE